MAATWLNTAHQGPLPFPAQEEVLRSLADKIDPNRFSRESFASTPTAARSMVARLLNAAAEDVLLANSTTYTVNLIAQGLDWSDGDEVVCVDGDFPASVLPWIALERRGVKTKLIRASQGRVDPDVVAAAITRRTRVVCLSWVFSFFGSTTDLRAVGEICRARNVWLVVNGSQAVGARPVDITTMPVDALACCGWKWLCGPYAAGFGWISEELRAHIEYPQPHWMRLQRQPGPSYELVETDAASRFDVLCSADFFGFRPLAASIAHLLDIGVERVAEHNQALVQLLIDRLHELPYRLISPVDREARSTLVVVSHEDGTQNERLHRALASQGISVAYYNDALRISPHLFNGTDEIEAVVSALGAAA